MSSSRPAYAVVDKSSRSQKKKQSFSRMSFAQSHHPSLPTSGAKRAARQSRSDDNQDFMSTPESGVCGSVFLFLSSSFHIKCSQNLVVIPTRMLVFVMLFHSSYEARSCCRYQLLLDAFVLNPFQSDRPQRSFFLLESWFDQSALVPSYQLITCVLAHIY